MFVMSNELHSEATAYLKEAMAQFLEGHAKEDPRLLQTVMETALLETLVEVVLMAKPDEDVPEGGTERVQAAMSYIAMSLTETASELDPTTDYRITVLGTPKAQ